MSQIVTMSPRVWYNDFININVNVDINFNINFDIDSKVDVTADGEVDIIIVTLFRRISFTRNA